MSEFTYLNDTEKAKIERFCDDKVLVEAVKKVILSPIYEQGTLKAGEEANPLQNGALALAMNRSISSEDLGRDLKAFALGVNHVEDGFSQLEKVKASTGSKPKKATNPGK